MRFQLSSEPICPASVSASAAGGFVTFEGKVRDHADGRAVTALEYDAYPEMAILQGETLLMEAMERFGLEDARAIHRTGALEIGDTAVVIQVAAAHRREAFEACEWIMDQLKWRVPIWKRESFEEGSSVWVGADSKQEANEDQERFARQMRLPQVGPEGQARLQSARVLMVGAGGLGAGAIPPLVAAGIGTLGILDPDTVDLTNLHRQTLFQSSEVGRMKAERAAAFAKRLRPAVDVQAFPVRLDSGNAEQYVGSYDWIIDGTDSLETKFLLSAVCQKLNKPLITASVHQFEGQLLSVIPDGPCLQCLFPEVPPDHCVGTCAQTGVLGVVPLLLGALQANEVVKGILDLPIYGDRMLLLDLMTLQTTTIRRTKRADCPGCAGVFERARAPWEIERLDEFPGLQVVDIRDPDEIPLLNTPHLRVPPQDCYQQVWDRPTVFICATGRRSFRLVSDLRARGYDNLYSLYGGVENLQVSRT